MIQSHVLRFYLQDLYLYIFGQDFMTHLIHYPSPFDKIFVDINWPAARCWKRLNPPQTASGEYLVFIHIPKCAGTSITSHLGIPNFHLTANILHRSNDTMFQKCMSFCTLRNPLQRRLSILRHFASSQLTKDDDKKKFKKYIQPRLNSVDLHRLFSDFILRRLVFAGSTLGRSGFSSFDQLDWISCSRSREIIVDYLIPLNHLFTQNYSSFCSATIGFRQTNNISHENKSSMHFNDSPFSNPDLYGKLEKLDRKLFAKEWIVWDFVNQNGITTSEAANNILKT